MVDPRAAAPGSAGPALGSPNTNFTFFVGCHQPAQAQYMDSPVMISYHRLRTRQRDIPGLGPWMLDSGAFTALTRHGRHRDEPAAYAAAIRRWARCGDLRAAVTQDYMCEPFVRRITGLSTRVHQLLTIRRFDRIRAELGTDGPYLMPVLQGYLPADYARHVQLYGTRLSTGMWVGVGSVCKRNGSPREALAVLRAIRGVRSDLRLHAFGLKTTALEHADVRAHLASADSMAWSYHARRQGRDGNDWREAAAFARRIRGFRPAVTPLDALWGAGWQ